MTTLAAREDSAGAAPPRPQTAAGARPPLLLARGSMLVALLAIGGLRWMSLLAPAEPFRAWEALAATVACGALLAVAGRLQGWLRVALATLATVAMVAACLLAGGVPDEYLRPDHWGALLAGIGRGIAALPGINVPYQGADPWTAIVLGIGGTMLMAAGTALALWPRRDRTGFPLAALVLLVTLAVVPAVVLAFRGEFVLGAVLSVLVLGFLRLEKLPRRDVPAAAGLGLAAAFAALVLAPVFDGRQPWWDYENWALSASTTRTTTFSWNHNYSPLRWPREGRELLRVRARQPAYWKAQDLDIFAGGRWLATREGRADRASREVEPIATSRWTQEIRVTVRNLRTPTFITAGTAIAVNGLPSGMDAFPAGGGAFGASRALSRGDSYRATVYTPRPTDGQLRVAGTDFPEWSGDYLNIFIAADTPTGADGPAGAQARPDHVVRFPLWGTPNGEAIAQPFFDRGPQTDKPAAPLLDAAGLGRIYRLAQRLKEGADTPFDYIDRVERYLNEGFSYSETPPRAAETLDGFLFDAKSGFCQQYSGAEGLLLRMAGIPARVAAGFTTGSLDRDNNEYVVRDLDAHSWVEAWFPSYGWVTRDPTPAAAPPRAQPGDASVLANGSRQAPLFTGDGQSPAASRSTGGGDGGTPVGWIVAGVIAGAGLVAGLILETRRRRRLPPAALRPLAEFERALRRARYDAGPGVTLTALERAFAGWPGAAAYVHALREQRYSGRPAAPTRDQRRSLRTALAVNGGHLRAWWALPPRSPVHRHRAADEDEIEIVRRARV